MGSVFTNGREEERAGQNGGDGALDLAELVRAAEYLRRYVPEARRIQTSTLVRDHGEALRENAARDQRRWERFCALWSVDVDHGGGIGRPFFKCVYCGKDASNRQIFHFTRMEKERDNRTYEIKLVFKPGTPVCNNEQFVRGLVLHFHALRGADGLTPWSATRFARWARSGVSHGTHCAAAFVLSVWNPSEAWRMKGLRFNFQEAYGVWDESHRAAFLHWAQNPWWP